MADKTFRFISKRQETPQSKSQVSEVYGQVMRQAIGDLFRK